MQYELLMGGECLLENRVNLGLRNGWKPIGGVAVAMVEVEVVEGLTEHRPRFYQAMTHEDPSARTVLEMEEDHENSYPLDDE